jgi:mannose-1-phosphate guanylyltransferase
MKAVVLVGGEGTRMRPLTETVPKPLLPLLDRHALDHVLDHLARHGVHEVVLSSPYLERTFHPFIAARAGDPAITWVTETDALGTGGAIVNALGRLGAEPFFALNGDILTDLDLTAMLAQHLANDAVVSIALHSVDDARAFGLVETEGDGRVRAFREKPEDSIPGLINAGTYLLDPRVFGDWGPGTKLSIERDIFPAVIGAGRRVFGFSSNAYWLDLGTPAKYLEAHFDMMRGRVHGVSYPSPWVGEGASIDLRAHLGRWVAVGAAARVGADAEIDDSVLLADAVVGAGAKVVRSILGKGAEVGAGAILIDSVLGERARAPAGSTLEAARISGPTSGGTEAGAPPGAS